MIRQNATYETALDEGAAAVAPTMSNTNSIEGVQLAVASTRDPPPAVSAALEIPATPPSEPVTAASHSTETVMGSPCQDQPWWSVPVRAQETEKDGQDKSDRIPDSLDMSASSLRNDLSRHLPTQGEEDRPTTSFRELQQPPLDESCLSSSGADFRSRQPGT